MALKQIDVNLDYYKTGDTFCIVLSGDTAIKNSDTNNSGKIAQNVVAAITLPTGLSFDTGASSVSQGTFTEGTGIWSIGSILPCKEVTASFCFEIDDDSEGPFVIDIDTTYDSCDCTIDNDDLEYTVTGVPCDSIQSCIVDSITYGQYADDAAAGADSVPVGGVYYNTTSNKLHTRMT